MFIRVATRRSLLALAQTRWVVEQIQKHFPDLSVQEVLITTEGDRRLDQSLARIGGKGLFVSELEKAIAEGRADMAVHSMKDVPERLGDGMAIVAVPERVDPRDALVSPRSGGLDG
ncbi:MAG: hydroxymethylbilane synthase, partial [Deltaproteobacteria bacterium]|nr:hydroxymethylbilane synthase [Deltaproteobacteria bacterium]